MKSFQQKRRNFIKNLATASCGFAAMPGAALNMKTWAAAAANNSATDGYKALVCFYMFGGNDGFNMLVPRGADEYADYQTSRSNLALAQEDLLPINPIDNQGLELGLHPNMSGIQQLFEDGNLSFLCNVGTKLKNETTIADVIAQQNIPLSLFSHNDQTRQWETAVVDERVGKGWGGQLADMMASCNTNENISMNVSFYPNPLFLRGDDTDVFGMGSTGPLLLRHYHQNNASDNFYGQRTTALNAMYNHDYNDPFYNNFNQIYRTGIDANIEFKAALDEFDTNVGLSSPFSELSFSQHLKMTAKSIAIGESMGFQRQIFFVHVGAFDNHDDLIEDHGANMHQVSTGLSEFYAALQEIGKENDVVTFSMSDFGRTLTSNGNGSDHAWGSNAIVMGGNQLNGKSLFGNYPSLALGSSLVYSNKGILIPGLASDLYFAELAHWFGVPMSDMGMLFPNLSEFFDASSGNLPIGFLNV